MAGTYFITEPNGYLEPRIAEDGVGAWPATTVLDVFRATVNQFGNEPAMCYKAPNAVSRQFDTLL